MRWDRPFLSPAARSPALSSGTTPATEPPRGRRQPLSSACSQRVPRRARCCSPSTTSSGSIRPRQRRWPSRCAACRRRSVCCSHTGWRPEELPLGLARALPEDRLLRIAPRPLSLAALHHLVKSRLGTSLPRPLLARLADASGGNPFYALEMARALAPHGDLKPAQPCPSPATSRSWWPRGSRPCRRPHGSSRSPRPPRSRPCPSLPRRFRGCRLRRGAPRGGGGGGADLGG